MFKKASQIELGGGEANKEFNAYSQIKVLFRRVIQIIYDMD